MRVVRTNDSAPALHLSRLPLKGPGDRIRFRALKPHPAVCLPFWLCA